MACRAAIPTAATPSAPGEDVPRERVGPGRARMTGPARAGESASTDARDHRPVPPPRRAPRGDHHGLRAVGLRDPLPHRLCRDGAGGDALPAGRFAACSPAGRSARPGCSTRGARRCCCSRRQCSATRSTTRPAATSARGCSARTTTRAGGTACSIASTSTARTPSSRSTAARPSSSAASCRSSGPSCRSSPERAR